MSKVVTPDGQVPVKRIGVFMQCRSNSTRLPNKWKLEIEGEPIIRHVYDRCAVACMGIRHPNLSAFPAVLIPEGDEVSEWCVKAKVDYFEGSADDLIDRYLKAAEHWNCSWIVRVTADCPLIPPALISTCVNVGIMHRLDYFSNVGFDGVRFSPDGFDVEFISLEGLRWLDKNVTGEDREHVGSYLLKTENRKKFIEKLNLADVPPELDLSHIKVSIDTQEDYERVKEEFRKLAAFQQKSQEVNSSGSTDKQQESES